MICGVLRIGCRVLMVFAGSAILAGCIWKGGERVGDLSNLDISSVWKIEPVRIRVYPSTRFIATDEQSILEARVELIDEMGDPIKATGLLRLELFARHMAGDPGIGRRLYVWDASILTLEEQRSYYDSITRTYLLRLKLDDEATARRDTILDVTFTSTEGQRLETQSALPIDFRAIESPP